MNNIGVIGAGSWGTTLANLLAEKGHRVDLWVREDEVYHQIKKERVNKIFLPGMELASRLNPVRSYEETLSGKELILMVVPSHVFREMLNHIKSYLRPGMAMIAATKGIENDTLMTMSQVAGSILSKEYTDHFACLAGPSFAREVFQKYPTAVTIACRDMSHAEPLQKLFST